VEVPVDQLKLSALPRPAPATSAETIMSTLAADALPAAELALLTAVTLKVAQAADSIALRDTGAPIVAGFSRGGARA